MNRAALALSALIAAQTVGVKTKPPATRWTASAIAPPAGRALNAPSAALMDFSARTAARVAPVQIMHNAIDCLDIVSVWPDALVPPAQTPVQRETSVSTARSSAHAQTVPLVIRPVAHAPARQAGLVITAQRLAAPAHSAPIATSCASATTEQTATLPMVAASAHLAGLVSSVASLVQEVAPLDSIALKFVTSRV